MIILQSCKQWTADFMTSVFTCTLQYITFELPTLKCLAKFPKWLPKQRKKVPMRRALSIFFDLLWYIPGENLWRIFNDPTRSLWKPFKIFTILVKSFRDISFSCQDLQWSSKFLPRSSRIFYFPAKILNNLGRKILKIRKELGKKIKDLGKRIRDPWRSWQELKDPGRFWTFIFYPTHFFIIVSWPRPGEVKYDRYLGFLVMENYLVVSNRVN